MNRTAAVLLMLMLGVAGVSADDRPPLSQFTMPARGLRLVERSDSFDKGSFAVWTGRLLLTGKLIVEFDRVPMGDTEQDTEGVAFFEPDEHSRQKLPRAIGPFYPLPPKVVWIEAVPREVLPQLIGEEKAGLVLQGTAPRFEIPVRIVITRFRTDVECDHRSYGVTYESISALRQEVFAIGEAKDIGC